MRERAIIFWSTFQRERLVEVAMCSFNQRDNDNSADGRAKLSSNYRGVSTKFGLAVMENLVERLQDFVVRKFAPKGSSICWELG